MQAPPDDVELSAFFECEPVLKDPGVPWVYNTLTFVTQRGSDEITCEISPSFATFSVSVQREGVETARADLAAFTALEIVTAGGREMLIARFGELDNSTLWLTLKPQVRLAVSA